MENELAKRFTDTEKWGKKWYRVLDWRYKLLWNFICDNCDIAGVWDVDLDTAGHFIGARIDRTKALEAFGGRIIELEDGEKWWVVKFVEFQYGRTIGELDDKSPVHAKVLSIVHRLSLLSLTPTLPPTLPPRVKDKEEDKEEDKDKDKNTIEPKKRFGDFVTLTALEYDNLVLKLGSKKRADSAIEMLDNAKGAKGYVYKSDYRAILSWVVRALEEDEAKRKKNGIRKPVDPPMVRKPVCGHCGGEHTSEVCPDAKTISESPAAREAIAAVKEMAKAMAMQDKKVDKYLCEKCGKKHSPRFICKETVDGLR